MKLQGHTFDKPNVEYAVIPRGDGPAIVFEATAVLDYADFDKYCPEPKPPVIIKPGGKREENLSDPDYLNALAEQGVRRMNWFFLKSLEATPGLTWDKVKMNNPKTWHLFEEELEEAHFSPPEIGRIKRAVWDANSLNESRVQEARENFLRGREAELEAISGQNTEAPSTQSGEPAKG